MIIPQIILSISSMVLQNCLLNNLCKKDLSTPRHVYRFNTLVYAVCILFYAVLATSGGISFFTVGMGLVFGIVTALGNYYKMLALSAGPMHITLLKQISEKSGVKIVASTGFYYLNSIECTSIGAEEMAKWLIRECKNGVSGTDVKPGILKCATGEWGITADNHKKLSVMGMVQGETGLPLYVHCEHREDIVQKQIEILCENGAHKEKIIIGHTAIRPDTAYLEKILAKGCSICMDQCHCYPHKLEEMALTLIDLCKRGYTDRILLSNDYCIHSDFCRREKNGLHLNPRQHAERLGYIFDRLCPIYISLGGSEKDLNTVLYKNPVKALDA